MEPEAELTTNETKTKKKKQSLPASFDGDTNKSNATDKNKRKSLPSDKLEFGKVKGKENDKISKADPHQEKGDNATKDNATKSNATKDNARKNNASKDDAKKSNDEKLVAKKSSGKDKSSVAKGKAKPIATKGGKVKDPIPRKPAAKDFSLENDTSPSSRNSQSKLNSLSKHSERSSGKSRIPQKMKFGATQSSSPRYPKSKKSISEKVIAEDDDSSSDDFEEVEEGENPQLLVAAFEQQIEENSRLGPEASSSDGNVEITLSREDLRKDAGIKCKKGFDWEKHFELLARRHKKEVREAIHNVHLLCLVARGFYLSDLTMRDDVVGVSLSLLPPEYTSRDVGDYNSYQLSRFYNWFLRQFKLQVFETDLFCSDLDLISCLSSKTAQNREEFVLMFLVLLRCLGFESRLVMSLLPLALKQRASAETEDTRQSVKGEEKQKNISNSKSSHNVDNRKSNQKPATDSKKTKIIPQSKRQSSKIADEKRRQQERESDEEEETEKKKKTQKGKGFGKTSRKSGLFGSSTGVVDDDVVILDDDEDSTSGGENDETETADGTNSWVEVYLASDRRWVPMDVTNRLFDRVAEHEIRATPPLRYVIGFGPGMRHAKDLTCKYASKWMTTTRKFRTDPDWWREVMDAYRQPDYREVEENMAVQRELVNKPMPTAITEFKSHPLFALRRHLLKFEAIYPADLKPIGTVKGEPVYPRSAVHELQSRFKWRQKARLVRLDAEAFKVVKARPKFVRVASGEWKKEEELKDLELFGKWQTEPFIAPPAVDGKVPRNEYGNVELFLMSMLPGGTVYLEGMPGLNSVAGKLDIDCAPAMVGFDFHGGRAHPSIEGWVVCEEFVDTLRAAWEEAQSVKAEKRKEKKTKRALDNWRLLVRGLFIREKLKRRYKVPLDTCSSKGSDGSGGSSSNGGKKGSNGGAAGPGEEANLNDNQWMALKNPHIGKEDKQRDDDLLPFEKL